MRSRSILVAALAFASIIGGCAATWSTTPSTTNTSSAAADRREVTGKIASYTTAPKGEMDGFVLDTGNRVHFPINSGAALLPYVQKGAEVKVIGTLMDRAEGKYIEATSITNVAKNETINIASMTSAPRPSATPPAEKPEEKPEKAKQAPPAATQLPSGSVAPPNQEKPGTLTGAELTSKEGKVKSYTTAPSGNMDGVILDNGLRIHFPEHVGKAVLPLVGQGKDVKIIGWQLTTPQGTYIEATKLIATPSGETVDIASIPLPPKPQKQ